MAYGGRGGDFGGSSSGFWGRLQNEANTRLQKTTSRMEEVAREMARRQAEAEQRRREEEERRRQQEAERQRREAEQRAEEQKQQAEEQSRMRLLEDQKRNEQAQAERGKLVLASLNQQDHENYRNALNSDQMLQQATWERDQAARMGDTQEAERVNAWINDRKNVIRGNTIPATRSTKTLAEYQAEWNNDADRLAEERAKKQEEARSLQSREGLSRYMAAKERADKAQAEADRAKKWITEQDDDGARVMAEARELAQRMGYREDQLPGTVEEMAALDPRIAENEQVKQYLDNKAFVKENAVKAKETADTATQDMKDARANEDVTTGDWGDLDRFNRNKWGGQVFNPIGYTKDGLDLQMSQISSGIDLNAYNDPQRTLARKVYDEVKRRYDIISDPKKALADLDEEIAWLEGLSGAYWDERGSEISDRLAKARAQRTLIMAAAMGGETNFKQRSENGYNAWHDAEGRTTADMLNVGLTGGKNESSVQRQNVIAGTGIGQNWAADQANQLSDEGQKILFLTDQEKAAFFALYNDSPEKAGEFLDAMSDEISQRRAAKREEVYREEAEKLPVLTDVMSSVVEVAKPLTAMGTLVQDVLSGKVNADDSAFIPDAYQQAVRGLRHEQLKDKPWASFLYDVGTQIGDNLSRAYGSMLMGIGNSKITTGAMAFGAAGSTYRELRSQGYDQDQAALASGIAGFAEYITEKWSDAEWFKGIEEGYTGFKNLMKSALQSAGQEGWTEVASDLISLGGEAIALGDDNSYNQKIKDYYYYTGDMEEARKLAFQDQLGQELYTFALSALSGAGMEVANRSASGIWKHFTENKKKEISGEGNSEQADQAKDSYGTQDGAEAAAEGAMPQYSSEELDEALMAAAAPMTAQEQQTDAELSGQETAQAVQAEADAQRAAEGITVPPALRNDNVSRLAREIAAGELAQGVEDMPVERRAEGPAGLTDYDIEQNQTPEQVDRYIEAIGQLSEEGQVPSEWAQQKIASLNTYRAMLEDRAAGVEEMPAERRTEGPAGEYRQNGRVPAGVRMQQAADRAEVEPMPVARREEMPAAEPGTVEAKVQAVPLVREQTVSRLAQEKVRKLADEWISEDDSAEDVVKNATLADVKANAHDENTDGIHDDAAWRETAGRVYDDLMDQYGADLADDTDGIWGKLAGYLTGQVKDVSEVFAKTNNPLFSTMQRGELYVMAGNIAEEYTRRMEAMKLKAQEMGRKYGFVTGEDAKADGGNGVVLRTVGDDMSPEQVTQLRILDRFAKNLRADGLPGLTINVYKDIRSTDGGKLNGSYNTDGTVKDAATVNLSLDAEGGSILRAAGHELYHMVETWGKSQADKIRGFVLDALQATEGYDLDARRAELKEAYGEDADIDSEIVADSMFDVLNNEETITQVMQENRSLGQRIRDFVGRIHTALKNAVERIAGMGSREAQALKDQADVLDQIRDMWTRGVEIAQRNIQAARAAENVEGYSIKAVADAADSEGRTAALDTVTGELVAKTQGDLMGDDAAENIGLRRKMMNALKAYGKGEKSLNAALEEQGLKPITGENDRKAAAWLSREAAEPARIQVSDRLSRQTLEEQFHEIWDEDEDMDPGMAALTEGPRNTAERALDLLYRIHDSRDRKGLWKENLDSFVEEIAEDSDVDRDKIKNMLKLLYTSIDNENRVYSQNAADYAGLIVDEIVNAHRGAERAVSEDETAVYKGLRGTVIQLSDALAPTSRQTKKDGTSLKHTRYDYGDINRYGTTVRQLNNFGRAAGIKFQLRSNEKNRGVAPSTLLAENPTLAAWVGFGDIDDNGNEADLLNRILDWVDSYERRSTMPADPDRLNKLGYGKVEKIILNYFDMPGQLDDTQRVVNAIRKQAEAEQKELQDEIYGLRWMIDYQNEKIEDARNERQMAVDELTRQEKAAAAAQRRIEKMKLREETLKQRTVAERQIKTLRQWFLHPTKEDGKHVSEELRSTIATALSLVDTGSRNPESIRTYDFNMLINAIDNEQKETGSTLVIDANLEPTLKYLAEKANGKMLMEMDAKELTELNDALKMIVNMCRSANRLRSMKQKEGIAQIGDSFIAGLQTQKDAKVRGANIQRTKDFLNYTMMDPERFFEMAARLGGEAGNTMWEILRKKGLDTQATLYAELEKKMHDTFDKYNYKDWAGGKNQRKNTFDLDSGEQITLTDAQIMDLYLLNLRDQGQKHIYGGGVMPRKTDLRGGVLHQSAPSTLTQNDVNRIISALSEEQIQAANELQELVGTWGSEIGNEASMELYGYKKFKEKHYFPIRTLGDTLGARGTEYEKNNKGASLYAVTNMGMTKELNEKARNAIVLDNVFDVALDHLADMITYRSWAAPLTDVTRILNYKTENTSVIREMNRVMGEAGTNYLIQLLKDINGLSRDHVEGQLASFSSQFRNFKAAAVGYNPGTVIKQGLSLIRAFDVIPMYYFPTARQLTERFQREGENGDRAWKVDKLMEQYAPIYKWKQGGRFTMDTGKDIKSMMLPKTEKALNKFTEFGMAAAGMADNVTWRTIWYAAEKMTERTHKDLQKGSEAYYRAVGDLFTKCVDRTQVVDSVLHRTQVMRSNSMWIRMATSFMGEPLKTWNQMTNAVRAFVEHKTTANAKKLAITGTVMLGSALVQALVNSVVTGLRHWNDDEPLEETIKRYLLGEYDPKNSWYDNAIEFLFGNNIANELNPINYIPLARDITDAIQGYEITRDDMQTITNVIEKGAALLKNKGTASQAKKIAEFAGALGDMMGIPASNIVKEVNFMSNWGSRWLEQMGMNTYGIQYLNLQWNKQIGQSSTEKDYAKFLNEIEQAAAEGKVEKEWVEQVRKDMIGAGFEEEKLEKKVAGIRMEELTGDTDLEGGMAKYEALVKAIDSRDTAKEKEIRETLARMGLKEDDIVEKMRTVRMKKYTTGTKVEDFYAEYVRRMKAGDRQTAGEINRILADSYAGKPENHTKGIKEALANDPDFVQAETARYNNGDTNAHMAVIRKYDALGFDHDLLIAACNLAYERAKKADKKESSETTTTPKTYGDSYGFTGTDLGAAFMDGSDSFWDVLEDLRKQGKTEESIKSAITSAAKPVYLELKVSNPAAADDLRHRLLALGLGYTERQIRGWK